MDAVFSYIADFQRHGEWDGDQDLEVSRVSPGLVAVGVTCERHGIRHVPVGRGLTRPKPLFRKTTVTEFIPNKRLGFELKSHEGTAVIIFDVEPTDNGTQITKGSDVRILAWSSLLMLPLLPLVLILRPWLSWNQTHHLRRIKVRVERMR